MNPITHALAGWAAATTAPLNRRERGLVTLAGIIPDFDGLGIVLDLVTRHTSQPTEFWGTYHHILGHNLGFALIGSTVAFFLSTKKWLTATLVFLSFHLHFLGDFIGATGPDGEQWPSPYLLPFPLGVEWVWSGQWLLNAWPNILITIVLLAYMFYFAWHTGLSPLEFVSEKANQGFIQILRKRFGKPN